MNEEQRAVKAIATSIHAKIANTTNLKNALQRYKSRNMSLRRELLRIKRLCDHALLDDFIRCEKCGVDVATKRGLIIHNARMHK